ncbi:MAG: hypothetical protein H7X88_00870 [Gloeobacteraceae cyanobacterium ES-bin-316]|nr:hypothetical protein [Ferruginibacter sp.]
MKILNSKVHGIIDYTVVAFLWLSPTMFGLPEYTSWVTYGVGGVHLTLTLLTDFEAGVFKIVPLKIHGWIELIVSIALAGVAFYLGNLEGSISRTFYLVFAAAVFITWLISDYNTSNKSTK